MSVYVNATGVRVLGGDLARAAATTGSLAGKVVAKTAHDIEADAKQLAPVDTGFLRNSISTSISGSAAAVTAEVGPTAEYGVYQELGTWKMAAQPYLGPAFDRHVDGFTKTLGQLGGTIL